MDLVEVQPMILGDTEQEKQLQVGKDPVANRSPMSLDDYRN